MFVRTKATPSRPWFPVLALIAGCAGAATGCGDVVLVDVDGAPTDNIDSAPNPADDATTPPLADAAEPDLPPDAAPDMIDAASTSCVDVDLGSAVGDAVFTGSTVGLPDDSSGCDGLGGGDLFLSWTAPAEGRFEFTTCGSNFDTTLGAITGSCDGPLVICNDDDNICFDESVQSRITLNVEQDDVIIVLLDGFEDAEGNAVLNINAL